MKKIFAIAIAFAAIALIQSCSSSQKHCAAYTKHETGDQPGYHDVQ